MAASCRHCGGEDGRYNNRENHFHCVKICEDCGDFCCDSCAPGQRCPQCHGARISMYEWRNRKQSSSDSGGGSSGGGTVSNYHPITDTTGQGFLLFSCIAAIWLLPAMIALWVFITVWYLFYKIFRIKRRPFDESYWVGAGAICLALIGGAIVGGICSLFLGPFGILIGLVIFIGILNTYD